MDKQRNIVVKMLRWKEIYTLLDSMSYYVQITRQEESMQDRM